MNKYIVTIGDQQSTIDAESYEHAMEKALGYNGITIQPVIDNDEEKSLAFEIIELFEELLDEKNISIPSLDRQGDEEEGRLFGSEYYQLEEGIINILTEAYKDGKVN
jgi:hypothetical protein